MRSSHRWLRSATDGDSDIDSHVGLAYERLAPPVHKPETGGESREKIVSSWLDRLAKSQEPADYICAFDRWRASLTGDPQVETALVSTSARLLVGHGNPSGAEVGLTLHRSWGVPLLPGSALKGVLAHHVAARYGARAGEDDPARAPWRGPSLAGGRVIEDPGKAYRTLFGSAASEAKPDGQASAGRLLVYDGLYVPTRRLQQKNRDEKVKLGRPLARDVITVHQKPYYDNEGRRPASDHADPVPIGFLTVMPEVHFLLALRGPGELPKLGMRLLLEALGEGGVGGKTSQGYGRLREAGLKLTRLPSRADALKDEIESSGGKSKTEQIRFALEHRREQMLSLSAEDRAWIARWLDQQGKKLRKRKNKRELAEALNSFLEELRS